MADEPSFHDPVDAIHRSIEARLREFDPETEPPSARRVRDLQKRLSPIARAARANQADQDTVRRLAHVYARLFTGAVRDDPDAAQQFRESLTTAETILLDTESAFSSAGPCSKEAIGRCRDGVLTAVESSMIAAFQQLFVARFRETATGNLDAALRCCREEAGREERRQELEALLQETEHQRAVVKEEHADLDHTVERIRTELRTLKAAGPCDPPTDHPTPLGGPDATPAAGPSTFDHRLRRLEDIARSAPTVQTEDERRALAREAETLGAAPAATGMDQTRALTGAQFRALHALADAAPITQPTGGH
jgi:hypothetical protein